MPLIVACPSCGGKLRVADALRGQRVRCPTCAHTFDSSAEPVLPTDAPRAPKDLPLDLMLDEPSSSLQPAPADGTGGLVGTVELQSSAEDRPAPPEPQTPSESPQRRPPRLADERLNLDKPDLHRRGPRRDAEPDCGAAVLSLGIISLAIIVVWCAAPIGVILGLAAWIMGQTDLRKMKRGQMDENGRGITQAGWICGILGTLLNGLITLGCGLLIGSVWYSAMNSLPNTRPVPAMRPPPPKKVILPAPKKPRERQ